MKQTVYYSNLDFMSCSTPFSSVVFMLKNIINYEIAKNMCTNSCLLTYFIKYLRLQHKEDYLFSAKFSETIYLNTGYNKLFPISIVNFLKNTLWEFFIKELILNISKNKDDNKLNFIIPKNFYYETYKESYSHELINIDLEKHNDFLVETFISDLKYWLNYEEFENVTISLGTSDKTKDFVKIILKF